MTINEAMNILDLRPGYTSEELNRNYKRKMREWHPDICNNPNAEKIAKKINEARAVLKKHLNDYVTDFKGGNRSYNTEDYNILIKRNEIMNDLIRISIYNFDSNKIDMFDGIIMRVNLKIGMILSLAEMELKLTKNIEDLEKNHIKYKKLILKTIKDFIEQYCENYNLSIVTIDDKKYVIEDEYKINIESGISTICDILKQSRDNRNILKRAFIKVKKLFKY